MTHINRHNDNGTESYQVVIIGAGIAGLSAARMLSHSGINAPILEQAPHVGGRLTTLKTQDGVFDVGAQHFTVRRPEFRDIVDFWLECGAAREWTRAFPNTSGVSELQSHPRYCGAAGMQGLAEAMSKDLDVRTNTRVKIIREGRSCWLVETEEKRQIQADMVVLTPPLPLSLRLISDENTWRMGALLHILAGITYTPLISVTAVLEGPSGLPGPGAIRVDDGPIAWITDNQMKGISPSIPAVTIQGTQRFCEARKQEPDEDTGQLLVTAAAEFLKSPVRTYKTHTWTHGAPSSTRLDSYYVVDGRAPLYFAGDAFAGGRIEGAAVSGIASALAIVDRMKTLFKTSS